MSFKEKIKEGILVERNSSYFTSHILRFNILDLASRSKNKKAFFTPCGGWQQDVQFYSKMIFVNQPNKLRFVCQISILLIAIGRTAGSDLHFVHRPDYLLILPRVVNANKPMNVFASCDYDDCRMVFLFQCFRYAIDSGTDSGTDRATDSGPYSGSESVSNRRSDSRSDSESNSRPNTGSNTDGKTQSASNATDSTHPTSRLVDVYDLTVFKRNLFQNRSQLFSFDLPNLDRCFRLDLGQHANRLAVEVHVQFANNVPVGQMVFKHRFDLTVSGFVHVKIATGLPVYRGGQTVRFFVLPFNLNFRPFSQALQISLIMPNKLVARRWTPSYFANDQLNEFAYRLADRPLLGLYTIEVTVLNQKFRKCFLVIEQPATTSEIQLHVNFRPDHLLLDQNRFEGSITISPSNEANLENYLIKCTIYLQFKDFVDRQEGRVRNE